MECIWCGFKSNDPIEFEKHLSEEHFLSYQEYCEIELTHQKDLDNFCFRCNKYRGPLSTLIKDFYYLPCRICSNSITKKTEKQELIKTIIKNIKSFYDYILSDRYLQLFLIDSIYHLATYSHDYLEFKKVLSKLDLPSRNDIWFLDWVPGYPKIISIPNLTGIKIVNLSEKYRVVLGKNNIEINNYKILFPEIVPYDKQHFSRYNILNLNSNRKTKRLKLDNSPNCVKFFNTQGYDTKSIFKVIDTKTEEPVNLKEISYQDYTIIKLILLRNKNYMRFVFSIFLELLGACKVFKDSVFLKNSINLNSEKEPIINISWLPEKNETLSNNIINISIL